MDVLISLIVLIISQCIRVANHHTVHLRSVTCLFVNYASVKLGRADRGAQRPGHWPPESARSEPGQAARCGAWSRFAVAEEKHRLVAYRWTDPGFHPGPSTHSVALDKSFDFLEPQFSVQWRRAGSRLGTPSEVTHGEHGAGPDF